MSASGGNQNDPNEVLPLDKSVKHKDKSIKSVGYNQLKYMPVIMRAVHRFKKCLKDQKPDNEQPKVSKTQVENSVGKKVRKDSINETDLPLLVKERNNHDIKRQLDKVLKTTPLKINENFSLTLPFDPYERRLINESRFINCMQYLNPAISLTEAHGMPSFMRLPEGKNLWQIIPYRESSFCFNKNVKCLLNTMDEQHVTFVSYSFPNFFKESGHILSSTTEILEEQGDNKYLKFTFLNDKNSELSFVSIAEETRQHKTSTTLSLEKPIAVQVMLREYLKSICKFKKTDEHIQSDV